MINQQKDKIRVQRTNFVVSNLEQSYKFYRDVLGFTVTFEKVSEPDSYSYDVFSIDKKHAMRFSIMSTPSQPRSLALTEISQPTLPSTPVPIRAAIVLDVDDVDAVVEASNNLGLKVYHEDALVTHDGREGREVGILDFDGNLIVIYSIPTA